VRAVVVQRPGVFGVQEVEAPRAGPGEVVVAVRACGLCGTDVHIAHGEFPPAPYPLIPGHEFAGVVVERGAGVESPVLGSRVAVDPTLPCGHCAFCREGRPNLCARWGAIGDTTAGALAERVAVPAANCYPVPAGLAWGEAALIEPLACAVWGVRRARPRPGGTALVYGGGTMGLLLAQLLRRAGAARVALVEPHGERRELAREVGVDAAAAPGEEASLRAECAPDGFDLVADATGIPAVVSTALGWVRRGGTLLIFGVAPPAATIPLAPYAVYFGDLTIVGSMAIRHTFGPAVRLAPTLALTPLLAPPRPLEAYAEAIAQFGRGPRPKQQLTPCGDGGA
jgi:2-desacetyl-2-hydroxyethyl bacteriochlorophyllide A dehydrogenase